MGSDGLLDSLPVDTPDAEVVEVVSAPVDGAQVAQQQQTGGSQGTEVLEDELRNLADSLNQTKSDVDYIGVQMQEGFGEVDEDLGKLRKGVRTLSEQLNETSGGETIENCTVTISQDQWAEMRDSWLWAKEWAGLSLFVAVVCALLVAALFGSRLWADFARGWRR